MTLECLLEVDNMNTIRKSALLIVVVVILAPSFIGLGAAYPEDCDLNSDGRVTLSEQTQCGQGNMGKTDDGTVGGDGRYEQNDNIGLDNDNARGIIKENGETVANNAPEPEEAGKAVGCSAVGEVIDGPAVAIGAGATCSLVL